MYDHFYRNARILCIIQYSGIKPLVQVIYLQKTDFHRICFAFEFLNGLINGIADNSNMVNPITDTTLASYLNPMVNAANEKPLPGGLNFQKKINR